MRREYGNWWSDEEPTALEMAQGATVLDEMGCEVDYFITHEPPSTVKSAMLLRSGNADRVNKLNGYFQEIGTACKFKHWYFGSLHEDRIITPHHTCVFRKMIAIPKGDKNTENDDNT